MIRFLSKEWKRAKKLGLNKAEFITALLIEGLVTFTTFLAYSIIMVEILERL